MTGTRPSSRSRPDPPYSQLVDACPDRVPEPQDRASPEPRSACTTPQRDPCHQPHTPPPHVIRHHRRRPANPCRKTGTRRVEEGREVPVRAYPPSRSRPSSRITAVRGAGLGRRAARRGLSRTPRHGRAGILEPPGGGILGPRCGAHHGHTTPTASTDRGGSRIVRSMIQAYDGWAYDVMTAGHRMTVLYIQRAPSYRQSRQRAELRPQATTTPAASLQNLCFPRSAAPRTRPGARSCRDHYVLGMGVRAGCSWSFGAPRPVWACVCADQGRVVDSDPAVLRWRVVGALDATEGPAACRSMGGILFVLVRCQQGRPRPVIGGFPTGSWCRPIGCSV
jgi:hypothetical protein